MPARLNSIGQHFFRKRAKMIRISKKVGLVDRELLRESSHFLGGGREGSGAMEIRWAITLKIAHSLSQSVRKVIQFVILKTQPQMPSYERTEAFNLGTLQHVGH